MRGYLRKVILALLLFAGFGEIYAEETKPDIVIDMVGEPQEDDNPKDWNKGHRMPPRHVVCIISVSNGISIPGVESSDYISYEIWDVTGENLLDSFSDESSFIGCVFNLKGEYCVNLVTVDRRFVGYLSI